MAMKSLAFTIRFPWWTAPLIGLVALLARVLNFMGFVLSEKRAAALSRGIATRIAAHARYE